jgi:uncharacterized membrane protein
MAAVNAPNSSWPSMAMLITPERSHRQPASAPRISGMVAVSVPWPRLMTLSGIAPASAQHSSETTKHASTTAMLIRMSLRCRVTVARTPASTTEIAPRA